MFQVQYAVLAHVHVPVVLHVKQLHANLHPYIFENIYIFFKLTLC